MLLRFRKPQGLGRNKFSLFFDLKKWNVLRMPGRGDTVLEYLVLLTCMKGTDSSVHLEAEATDLRV